MLDSNHKEMSQLEYILRHEGKKKEKKHLQY